MSNENIRKKWEEFKEEYGEYILSGEDLWRFNLEKVKKRINDKKKKPNRNSKDPEEKKEAYWIEKQNYQYKNKLQIMSNENIRKEWEEFKEEYGEFFK